jgi:hypothetical protein
MRNRWKAISAALALGEPMLRVSARNRVPRLVHIRTAVTRAAALAAASLCACGGSAGAARVTGVDGGAGAATDATGRADGAEGAEAGGDGSRITISVDGSAGGQGAVHVAVPAYFYPGPDWQRLIAAAPTVGLAVFNPQSGPGTATDPNYVQVITDAKAAGITVLGYVATSYGQRAATDVTADIDAYYKLYPVSGIYLAEGPMEADCSSFEAAYQGFVNAAHAHDPGAFMAVGTRDCPTYIVFFDLMVQFARNWTEYQAYVPPPWMPAESRGRFCHLVNAVPAAAAGAALSLAIANGAGWVFVTDEADPNPWDRLPSYFDDEIRAVQTLGH